MVQLQVGRSRHDSNLKYSKIKFKFAYFGTLIFERNAFNAFDRGKMFRIIGLTL